MKRAIIFWDFSNFKITVDKLISKNVDNIKSFDYVEFAKTLQGEDDLIKIYFACSKTENEKLLSEFYKAMDYKPFFYVKVFEKNVDPVSKKVSEKQLDVYIATQMVALAYENTYDIAYLISGDEDFIPAVEIVQQKGKVVVAVSASDALSQLLKRKADKFILIDDNQAEKNKLYFYKNFLKG